MPCGWRVSGSIAWTVGVYRNQAACSRHFVSRFLLTLMGSRVLSDLSTRETTRAVRSIANNIERTSEDDA